MKIVVNTGTGMHRKNNKINRLVPIFDNYPIHAKHHPWSRRSRIRIALRLRLHQNDAALARQHCCIQLYFGNSGPAHGRQASMWSNRGTGSARVPAQRRHRLRAPALRNAPSDPFPKTGRDNLVKFLSLKCRILYFDWLKFLGYFMHLYYLNNNSLSKK
jgi:hypothetical protein